MITIIKSSLQLSLVSFLLFSCTGKSQSKLETQPNVIIIYGDDVGYGDVGAYGSTLIPTPNIDRLASESLRFTDGHCSAATCTPSRYSLLTGIHGFRGNVNILPPEAPLSIPTNILTLPKLFQKAGYKTGIVGKWHLGLGEKGKKVDWNGEVKPGPIEVGFDSSFILPVTNDRVPCVYLNNYTVPNLDKKDPIYVDKKPENVNGKGNTQYPNGVTNPESMTYYKNSKKGHNHTVINGVGRIGYMSGGKSALWDDEEMTDTFVKKAKEYIKTHQKEPFFLYYAAQDIHVPRMPHKRFQGKTKLGYRGDAMVEFDWATGEILNTLEKCGISDNTIIIFSSDNGPVYDDGYQDGTTVVTSTEEVDRGHDGSGIWSAGKYQIFEGGTRVPFMIKWPSKIKPGVSEALVNQIDIVASFADLFDISLANNEAPDSRNTLNAFLGKDEKGLTYMLEEAPRVKAIRKGNWKYIQDGKRKFVSKNKKYVSPASLFNLKDDPAEKNDLIDKYPEIAKELKNMIEKLIAAEGVRNNI